jgi:hypothetical protein
MDNFIIDVAFDEGHDSYIANYSDGNIVVLNANNYQDAVLEADMLDVELGYN